MKEIKILKYSLSFIHKIEIWEEYKFQNEKEILKLCFKWRKEYINIHLKND
jgi:hypothetical protein